MNPSASADLARILKRLKLSGILHTLPDLAAYALDQKLHPLTFLELCLQDEVERRDAKNLHQRVERAQLSELATLERFDWNARITIDRERVHDLFGLGFLHRHEDVIFHGPTGPDKTFLASALAHSAIRAGHRVVSIRSDSLLKTMHQSRADHTTERVLRSFLMPALLVIDDFGLKRLTAQQSSDLYETSIERHKRSSTIITSNRAIDEWIPLFDDPLLAQSALDHSPTTPTKSPSKASPTAAANDPAKPPPPRQTQPPRRTPRTELRLGRAHERNLSQANEK